MIMLPVSLTIAAGAALLNLWLSMRVGRVLHAIGMDGMMWGRMVGTIITMLTQLGLAGYALFLVYSTPVGTTATLVEETVVTEQ